MMRRSRIWDVLTGNFESLGEFGKSESKLVIDDYRVTLRNRSWFYINIDGEVAIGVIGRFAR